MTRLTGMTLGGGGVDGDMTSFAITWDYRCPFARNANEHVLAALAAGADWDVTFVPFSLGQVHVAEGETPVWERPEADSGLLALQAGTWVRDNRPEAFPAVHHALFAARHDEGKDLRDVDVVTEALTAHGVDADAVLAAIADGTILKVVQAEHEQAASQHGVWGVPTFIRDTGAVFVRLMDRPGDDSAHARKSVEQVLDLIDGFGTLNEFKHTSLDR